MNYVLLPAAAVLNVIWIAGAAWIPLPFQLMVPVVTVLLVFPTVFRRPKRALTALLAYYLGILLLVLFFGGVFQLKRS